MEDQQISVELSRLCRICVVECSHMSPLSVRDSDVSCRLDDMLMSCTNLKILEADGFPNSICDRCVDELKTVYGFQQRCEIADRYYKQLRLKSNSECTETETVYNKRPNYDYIEILENDLIVFRCRECSQAFSTIKDLKNHKQIHSKNEKIEEKHESLNLTEPVDFTEGENEEEHLLEIKQEEINEGDDEYLNSSFFENFNSRNTEENFVMDVISMGSEIKEELFTDTVIKEENVQHNVSNFTKRLEVVLIPKECKRQHGDSLTVEEPLICTEKEIEYKSHLTVMKGMDARHDKNVESSSSDDQDEDYSPSDDSDTDYFPNQTHRIGTKNEKHQNTRRQHRLLQKLNSPKIDCPRIFQCTDCGQKFDECKALQDHHLLHSCGVDIKPLTCFNDTKGHLRSHDSEQRLSKCDIRYHEQTHNPNKSFKCDMCEKSFPYSRYLQQHKRMHIPNKRLKCDVCGKSFSCTSYLQQHKRIHDPNKRFKCDVCEKLFIYSWHLKSHKLKRHADKHLKCDVCEKLFACRSILRKHQLIHNANKPFKCEVCEKSYLRNYELREHEQTHNPNKHFKCDVCGKSFAGSRKFRHHKWVHNPNKRFKCDVCEKQFVFSSSLKSHKLKHNTNKPFKCDVCEKSFVYSWTLKSHKLTHDTDKHHKCDVCEKLFASRSTLRRHQLTHNANKLSKCDMCEQSFSCSTYLRQHKWTHNPKKRFNCDVCGKSYTRNNALEKHKLTHNANKHTQ